MTAIAAIRYKHGIIIGGDSAYTDTDYGLLIRKDPKVFRVGELLFGGTSSYRMIQLIRYGLADCLAVSDLRPSVRTDAMEFMMRDFIPRARWLLREGGYTEVENGVERSGEFIVAWGREMFTVHDNFEVVELFDDYSACGCASDIVLGALGSFFKCGFTQRVAPARTGPADVGKPTVPHADYLSREAAEEAISRALALAEHHSTAVRGPRIILSTAWPGPAAERKSEP